MTKKQVTVEEMINMLEEFTELVLDFMKTDTAKFCELIDNEIVIEFMGKRLVLSVNADTTEELLRYLRGIEK